MFMVTASYPLSLHTALFDGKLIKAAGRTYDRRTSDAASIHLTWLEEDFGDALNMRIRLRLVKGAKAFLREE